MHPLPLYCAALAAVAALSLTTDAAAISVAPSERRLIEFASGRREWLTLEQVDQLASGEGVRAGFFDVTDHAQRYDALNATESKPVMGPIPAGPTHQDYVKSVLPSISAKSIQDSITQLSSYYTRYYTTNTSVEAVLWLSEQYREFSAGRTDVTIQLWEHTWAQPSLVVTVLGRDKTVGPETVVIGGHIDSINNGAVGRAPGADDDASGSSTVLEAFRVLMASGYQPDRTVEFHAYAAEEVGLRGSQAIAEAYSALGRKVVSMLQLDMTCWPYPEVGDKAQIGVITDYTSPALTQFVRQLIDAYCDIGRQDSLCGYGCSDHASWQRNGFDAAFPFESVFEHHNPHIHTDRDTLQYCQPDHAAQFAKLAVGYIVEMATLV